MPLHLAHFSAMGGPCEVQFSTAQAAHAAAVQAAAQAEVQRIEWAYSRYRTDSVISRINAAAGVDWTECDAETLHLLELCDRLYRHSAGLFDATSGVLRRAWNFHPGQAHVPSDAELAALLPLVGWQRLLRRGNAVMLEQPGMQLDFGGVGKEYAADRVAQVLQSLDVRHGLVNLAGDLRVWGGRPDGSPWRLGIQHPRQPGAVLAEIPLHEGALATSGDYERCLIDAQGKRHCHILHPATGRSAQGWQSITTVAPLAVVAGGLSTIAMLQGAAALPWLQSQGVSYLAVDAEGQVHSPAAENH